MTIETVAPPTIAGVSLITGTQGLRWNQQGLSIVGTAPANDQVQVDLGGSLLGTASANSQGAWSYTYAPTSTTVPAGTYDFSAVAIDQSGNVSAASPTFPLEVGGGPDGRHAAVCLGRCSRARRPRAAWCRSSTATSSSAS